MPVAFAIDPASGLPPFEQVKGAVKSAIADGTVVVGEKLPAIRALAAELGLAVNTVARSYKELEDEGYVATHGRSGTTISPRAMGSGVALDQFARAYVAAARELGVSRAAATRAVEAHWKA